jgi:hypothetical protein
LNGRNDGTGADFEFTFYPSIPYCALAKLLILIFSDKQGEPKPSAEGDPLFIHLFPATKPVLSLSKELGLVFRIYSKKTTY